MQLQFPIVVCSCYHYYYNVPLLISVISTFIYRVSGNGLQISLEDVKHYDIIFSSNEIGNETWSGGNQVSVLSHNHPMNLSSQLQNMPSDMTLKNYGHAIFLIFPKSQSDLFSELIQISKFHNDKSLIWKPHFFLRIPQELINVSINSFESFIVNLSIKFPITSDVYITFPSNSSGSSGMLEMYSIGNYSIVQDTKNSIKTRQDGSLNFNSVLQKGNRRSNFYGNVITAVSMDVHGYEVATDFDDDNSTITRFIGGFEVVQFWFLRDALNFSEAAVKGIGYVREGPGGTLTGMAASINKGDADLCISATEFLEYRASGPDGISYLHPTFQAPMLAFFKQPPASSIRDVFISSFSLNLWFMLFGLWIVIIGMMKLAYRIYLKWFKEIDDKDLMMSDEIPIWAAGAICQQGWYFTPTAYGARIIFFSGWFTGSLCYTAFSASLVSILAVEVVPIHSFADLLREKFYIYNDGHIPTTKYFVKGLQATGQIPEVPEALRNVEIEDTIGKLPKSRSTMITLWDSFLPIVLKEGYSDEFVCNVLSVVTVGTRPVMMSMFVKRASPLRELFNTKIITMTERGLKHRVLTNYLIETSVQCLKGNSGFHAALSSKDVFTAYAIIIAGLGLSFTIGIAEKIFRKLYNRDSHSTDVNLLNVELDLYYFQKKQSVNVKG